MKGSSPPPEQTLNLQHTQRYSREILFLHAKEYPFFRVVPLLNLLLIEYMTCLCLHHFPESLSSVTIPNRPVMMNRCCEYYAMDLKSDAREATSQNHPDSEVGLRAHLPALAALRPALLCLMPFATNLRTPQMVSLNAVIHNE